MNKQTPFYEVFSTEGKFHKAAPGIPQPTAWTPSPTACGLVVTPVNYFLSQADANNFTGGRLHLFMCKHCAKADAKQG